MICCALLAAGCMNGGADQSRIDLDWSLDPDAPRVGSPAVFRFELDDEGEPVERATLRVEAHMAHPGMQPVIATAYERRTGVYEAPLRFTMAGDWILVVDGELPDGRWVTRRIDVAGVRPARGAGASP